MDLLVFRFHLCPSPFIAVYPTTRNNTRTWEGKQFHSLSLSLRAAAVPIAANPVIRWFRHTDRSGSDCLICRHQLQMARAQPCSGQVFTAARCICVGPSFGMHLQHAIASVFTLLAPFLLATVCAEPPFEFKFLPDGPPYSLLDLPVLSAIPPFPRSFEILDMRPSEKIHFNSGNLFIKVSDSSSSWAHAQVTYQVRDLLPGPLSN